MFPVLVGLGRFSSRPETVDSQGKPLHDPLFFAEGEIVGDHGDEF